MRELRAKCTKYKLTSLGGVRSLKFRGDDLCGGGPTRGVDIGVMETFVEDQLEKKLY